VADANTGSVGVIRVDVSESSPNPATNQSVVSWAFYLIELRGTSNSTFGNGKSATVDWSGVANLFNGTFSFDWRAAGQQTTLIASGSFTVTHNPDGSGSVTIQGNMGATGTSGAGGPTSVAQGLTLTKLTSLPGVPSSVAASRISDTQATVSWAQTSPSNGQPTSNTIRQSVNGGAFTDVVTISPATSATIPCAANQKIVYGVKGANAAGSSAWSANSAPLYTTPAAPSSVAATKSGSDIIVTFVDNVAFVEHQHVLEHGVDVAGTITWDGSPLATISAGTLSYTHAAPNPAQRHVYRLTAKNTDTGALTSAPVQSNVVQLLAPPNKPTVPAPAAFQDKAATFRFAWVHNPVDTSAQTKRQVRTSIDGGSTWTTGAKTADVNQYLDFAGGTWTANTAVTFQVRTKGQYDSGSDGDASYSPWSDSVTVTFKTKPVATITAPANASTATQAALTVVLGFSQAEAATFVTATIGLYSGATLLEEIVSTTLAGTLFATRVLDGNTYTVKATVTDSNGLVSAQASSTFDVNYTEPVPAVATVTYLPDSGIAQIDLIIAAAGGGFVAAVAVTIDRTIGEVQENVITAYPSAAELTILDTTPTIFGDNVYAITTISGDGATSVVYVTLTTVEQEWAFLSKGPGFGQIIRISGTAFEATPTVDSTLVKAAGRRRPIGLYANTGNLVVTGKADLAPGYGSTPEEIEAFLLTSGKGCYRDASGRRMFGQIAGKISRPDAATTQVTYTVTETD
jgi:hypothetical protein